MKTKPTKPLTYKETITQIDRLAAFVYVVFVDADGDRWKLPMAAFLHDLIAVEEEMVDDTELYR